MLSEKGEEFQRLTTPPVDQLLFELNEYPFKASNRLVGIRRAVGPAFVDLLPHLVMLNRFVFPGRRRDLYDVVLKIIHRADSSERAEEALRIALRAVWTSELLSSEERVRTWLIAIANRARPDAMVAELSGVLSLLEESPSKESFSDDEDYE